MHTQGWFEGLAAHAARLSDIALPALISAEPQRAERDALRVGPIYASFARQRLDQAAWEALYAVAEQRGVLPALRRQLDGEVVNGSEQRPALHTALRSDLGQGESARAARGQVHAAREAMGRLAQRLRDRGITDLINVGIGGSDLGPRLVTQALAGGADRSIRVHFLSSPDGHTLQAITAGLDPARTAILLVSKSFSTEETRLNAEALLAWSQGRSLLLAATAKVDSAAEFGVAADAILPLWDWVGGRYSLWSAVGFSILATLGENAFDRLLAGAALMDAHVASAPAAEKLPLRHALVAVWNRNALGYDSQAVLPYDQRLQLLPSYLQQLVMESLGKSVFADGSAQVRLSTSPVIWGGPGTDCQHSYFQALHQGTDGVPAEFIGVLRPDHDHTAMHRCLLANLLAQSEALANGVAGSDPHRHYPGSRPSTVILLDALTPESLGALIALYEHSVYLQSVIWGINAFDQWGVELGKVTAQRLQPAVDAAGVAVTDPVTARLIAEIHRG